jgi:hypothetical protein
MTTPGGREKCCQNRWGKRRLQPSGSPPDAKPATSTTTGNTADQNRLKPCRGEPFELLKELELESQKGNPRLVCIALDGD